VRVYGIGTDKKPFVQEARSMDITRRGARLEGVHQIRDVGEIIGVQYEEKKARLKVVWVGEPGSKIAGQIGLLMLDQVDAPWAALIEAAPKILEPSEHTRDWPALKPREDIGSAFASQDLTARVAQTTTELKELERLIGAGTVDARILAQFREALNHVRQTSWAVQKWMELQAQKQDPYSAMELLTAERIRCATQLSKDLVNDIESQDISFDTSGLLELLILALRLAQLFEDSRAVRVRDEEPRRHGANR